VSAAATTPQRPNRVRWRFSGDHGLPVVDVVFVIGTRSSLAVHPPETRRAAAG